MLNTTCRNINNITRNINSGGKVSGIKDDGKYKTHSESMSTSLLKELRFQDRVYTRFGSTPGVISRLNMDFDLWKNGSLNAIGYYYGNIWGAVTKMKNSGYVSFELSQQFSKGKWRVTAGVMDAFKTFRSNTWKSDLPNVTIRMDSDDDSRYMYISFQYRIGKMKSPRNSNRIISDEKNRL